MTERVNRYLNNSIKSDTYLDHFLKKQFIQNIQFNHVFNF